MPTKLLFIVPSAYPLGGVATWLDYLVPGMEERGWDITIGLVKGRLSNPQNYLKRHPFKKTLEIENKTGTPESAIRSICRTLQACDFDLVVISDIPGVYAAAERMRKSGHARFKVATTMHALWPDFYEDIKTYKHVIDGVVCSNKLACALVEQISGVERKRIHYAPCGVSLSEKPTYAADGPLRIAYVGRLEKRQKRISDLPKVLKKLNENNFDYEMRVFGDGPDALQLRKALSCADIRGKLRFFGEIPYDKINEEAYGKSDVLLVTSFWETGPIVMWEAMANGLAVVSSRYIGSGKEEGLRHEENCLLFPIGDTQAASEQIIRLKDRDLVNQLIHKGHELIAQRYSQEHSVGSWEEAFTTILSLPSLPLPEHCTKISSRPGLDWICGTFCAEDIREAFNLRAPCNNEWSHAYSRKNYFDRSFWAQARKIEQAKNHE